MTAIEFQSRYSSLEIKRNSVNCLQVPKTNNRFSFLQYEMYKYRIKYFSHVLQEYFVIEIFLHCATLLVSNGSGTKKSTILL